MPTQHLYGKQRANKHKPATPIRTPELE